MERRPGPSPAVAAHSVVALRAHRPPTPTLFPYTTLFRSLDEIALRLLVVQRGERKRLPRLIGDDDQLLRVRQDRKSTRLNSSHVSISYAVFCLKKNTSVVEHYGIQTVLYGTLLPGPDIGR